MDEENKEKLELKKKIISNIAADKTYGISFEKLANPKKVFDSSKVIDMYTEAFFNIPIKGKNSHKSIIKQSWEHINPTIIPQRESIKEDLVSEIETLNKVLFNTQKPPPENLIYPNGSMLIAGADGAKFDGFDTVYVMDRGVKRGFASWELYLTCRDALKIVGDPGTEYIFLSLPELNSIPSGKRIESGADFSTPIEGLSETYADLYFERESSILLLKCEGMEVPDSYDVISADYYVDNSRGCTVTYIEDEYYGDEKNYTIKTTTIDPGSTLEIEVLKQIAIPNDLTQDTTIYNQYYNYGNVSPPQNWWEDEASEDKDFWMNSAQPGRKWGKDREYKGILFANGRIEILKINGNILPSPDIHHSKWFLNAKDTTHNIPSHISFEETVGNDDNRRIYNHCQSLNGTIHEHCYGRLNQINTSTKNVFNDFTSYPPTSYYYNTLMNISKNVISQGAWQDNPPYAMKTTDYIVDKTYSMYGQPILKGSNNHNLVFLDVDPSGGKVWFWDIEGNGPLPMSWIQAQSKFMMVKEGVGPGQPSGLPNNNSMESNDFHSISPNTEQTNYFNWTKVNSARINYIGLVGTNSNGNIENDNYWNAYADPNTHHGQSFGDNYRLHPMSQQKLDANLQPEFSTPGMGCSYTEGTLLTFYNSAGILPPGCHFGNCTDC